NLDVHLAARDPPWRTKRFRASQSPVGCTAAGRVSQTLARGMANLDLQTAYTPSADARPQSGPASLIVRYASRLFPYFWLVVFFVCDHRRAVSNLLQEIGEA